MATLRPANTKVQCHLTQANMYCRCAACSNIQNWSNTRDERKGIAGPKNPPHRMIFFSTKSRVAAKARCQGPPDPRFIWLPAKRRYLSIQGNKKNRRTPLETPARFGKFYPSSKRKPRSGGSPLPGSSDPGLMSHCSESCKDERFPATKDRCYIPLPMNFVGTTPLFKEIYPTFLF